MPARLSAVTTFCAAVVEAVTRCTRTSSFAAVMPAGSRTPACSSSMNSCGRMCRISRSGGRAMALAFATACATSSRLTSRGRLPRLMPPCEFTPRTCEPATPTGARSAGIPAAFSAASTAFCTGPTALARSTMMPLREPRDAATPCARYRSPLSVTSATSAQVLALPTSMAVRRLTFGFDISSQVPELRNSFLSSPQALRFPLATFASRRRLAGGGGRGDRGRARGRLYGLRGAIGIHDHLPLVAQVYRLQLILLPPLLQVRHKQLVTLQKPLRAEVHQHLASRVCHRDLGVLLVG